MSSKEYYHDDSCGATLTRDMWCPTCNYFPDMQSIGQRPVGSDRGRPQPKPPALPRIEAPQVNAPTQGERDIARQLSEKPTPPATPPLCRVCKDLGVIGFGASARLCENCGRIPREKRKQNFIGKDELNLIPEYPHSTLENGIHRGAVLIAKYRDACLKCKGTGNVSELPCDFCKGTGRNPEPPIIYYGKDIFDPDARCTADAFMRHLRGAPIDTLQEAYRSQEREMLSASDWYNLIHNEIRRRAGLPMQSTPPATDDYGLDKLKVKDVVYYRDKNKVIHTCLVYDVKFEPITEKNEVLVKSPDITAWVAIDPTHLSVFLQNGVPQFKGG